MSIIAIGLTVVCLFAAIILGGVFYVTEPAKVKNIAAREQSTIRELLSLSEQAKIAEVRRYLFWRGDKLEVIYLTPKVLVRLDPNGQKISETPAPADVSASTSPDEKDLWVTSQIPASGESETKYVGRFFVGLENEVPAGFVVEGLSAGYKTWIRFFLAINSEFGVQGLEIIEHEEDPGLGDEITKRYFKNQYAGRSSEAIENIRVIKDPLPNKWRKILEELGEINYFEWIKKYTDQVRENPNIHAITGATISSDAVNDGVKRSLANFKKRMTMVGEYL